jgi:hypothetical protein
MPPFLGGSPEIVWLTTARSRDAPGPVLCQASGERSDQVAIAVEPQNLEPSHPPLVETLPIVLDRAFLRCVDHSASAVISSNISGSSTARPSEGCRIGDAAGCPTTGYCRELAWRRFNTLLERWHSLAECHRLETRPVPVMPNTTPQPWLALIAPIIKLAFIPSRPLARQNMIDHELY